jgi:hypothetical protein
MHAASHVREVRHPHGLGRSGLRRKRLDGQKAEREAGNQKLVRHELHSGSGWLHSKDGAGAPKFRAAPLKMPAMAHSSALSVAKGGPTEAAVLALIQAKFGEA